MADERRGKTFWAGEDGILVDIRTEELQEYSGIFILRNSNRARKENKQDYIIEHEHEPENEQDCIIEHEHELENEHSWI